MTRVNAYVEGVSSKRAKAAFAAVVAACVLAIGSSAALAYPSLNEGGQIFPAIYGPTDSEEFSWEVTLGEEQELRQIDEQGVGVYYSDGLLAFVIHPEPAHDADGATVPTTLRKTGESVITLTVYHREGNPAAGGTPFVYPVTAGPGWEGGFVTTVIEMPPGEQQPGEEKRCRVPALRGATVAGAKRRLVRADCRLGAVTMSSGVTKKTGRVVHQTEPAGSSLTQDGRVGIKLGPRRSGRG